MNEELVKEYLSKGNNWFSIGHIDVLRDGGTIVLRSTELHKIKFYVHKDDHTLHYDYPTTNENLITDDSTKAYIQFRLEKYKKDCDFNLRYANYVIEKIK
jgi:hypothetical protein